MRQLLTNKSGRRIVFGFLVGAALIEAVIARAVEIDSNHGVDVPCAVVENFGGEARVFDASRTQVTDVTRRVGVPCGGWVSSVAGWVELRMRDGHRVHLGDATFARFTDAGSTGDPVILYSGQIFAETDGGSGQLRIITPDARVRLSRGAAIVVFNGESNETQAIALEQSASIENRFEPSRSVSIRAGEGSSLNLKLLRVVPSAPRAVSVASLRPMAIDLHLSDRVRETGFRAARDREERRFASNLSSSRRAPASASPIKHRGSYLRIRPSSRDEALHERFTRKLAGGSVLAEKILHPDHYYGRAQKVLVQVEDADARFERGKKHSEDLEKKRLIEELSRIRGD